jgi:PleD family two-component response regulator
MPRISHEKSEVPGGIVTISLGVAVAIPTRRGNRAYVILGADRTLYLAKNPGGSQVKTLQI